jgi:streptogramin lyase
LFLVNVTDGRQSVLTKDFRSTFMGIPADEHPRALALAPDGSIVVGDGAYGHIVRFNSDGTGRQLLAELPVNWLIEEIAVDGAGMIYITVLNLNPNGVVRVNPADGSYQVLTQGGNFLAPVGLGVAPDGSLIVGDAKTDSLVHVNTSTGEQTVLLSNVPSPRSIWVFGSGAQPQGSRLEIGKGPSGLTVSWLDPDDRWQLQSRAGLDSSLPWTDVDAEPGSVGPKRQLVYLAGWGAQFFRLRQR